MHAHTLAHLNNRPYEEVNAWARTQSHNNNYYNHFKLETFIRNTNYFHRNTG